MIGAVWRWLRRVGLALWLWELSVVAWALLVSYFTLGRRGHLDWLHHAIGRDFINSWTAGQLTLRGQVADIFWPPLFLGHERALFDARLPFHFWSYPPPNLFLTLPLGLLPYMPALALWTLAGLAALYAAVRVWTPDSHMRWLLMFAPAVATNIGLGQNGAFTAALLIAGLSLIDRRPRLAGVLLGLLIFKPQVAVLLPVAVLAGRRWQTMGAAAATVVAVLLASWLAFGAVAWQGFFGPTMQTQTIMLVHGRGPFQWMMPSAYMSARLLHLKAAQAALAQLPFSGLAVALTAFAWLRREKPLELRAAILMLATFVATPQVFNYDLIPASAAVLVLLWRDPRRWVALCLALLVWATPVAMMGLEWIKAPVAPLVLTAALIRLAMLGDVPRQRRMARAPSRGLYAQTPETPEGHAA
jgi:hypothetical protein